MTEPRTIDITVDKSHIVTIGERMYTESIELLKELVNNAYDADATRVDVSITESEIVIQDDGSGMDEDGLKQYFTIGSTAKRQHAVSPRFQRLRIGEFGIGKFASLTAAEIFEITTFKEGHCFKVVFDKAVWESTGLWSIPIEEIASPEDCTHGTIIRLAKLKKTFSLEDVRKRLVNRLPLKAPNFEVLINDEPLTLKDYPGKKFEFQKDTVYGDLHGYVVLTATVEQSIPSGLDCRVKGVLIKRELFNLPSHISRSKIIGEVNADWLPVTSARNDFIKDSPEYLFFDKVLRHLLDQIISKLNRELDHKEKRRSSEALREAVSSLKKALKNNLDLCPKTGAEPNNNNPGQPPTNNSPLSGEESISLNPFAQARKELEAKMESDEIKAIMQKEKLTPTERKKKAESLAARVKASNVQKLMIAGNGFTFITDHFGTEAPESFTQKNIICINQDHPVYLKCEKQKDTLAWNYLRLIAREIILLDTPHLNIREVFDRQSRLMSD